ncbi:MAG: type II/IV secretion system protein [Saprospiraceae bacterium]|nr:type II/IV secretion system protein [Saprospiraceae bacterium]
MTENIAPEILQQLSATQAWHYGVLPFRSDEHNLWVYAADTSADRQEELGFLLGKTIHAEWLDADALRQALTQAYRKPAHGQVPGANHSTDAAAARVASAEFRKNYHLDALLLEAKQHNASDIHLEPFERFCRIRFRIDGVLIERYQMPTQEYPALVNKIKIRANLDIAEKRLPQDGRIFVQEGGQKFDIRVSSLPTLHGEKIVLRLLSGSETRIDIQSLGFIPQDLERYLQGVSRPNGMVLISGPTGSGKTTTLYATLQLLNSKERNILTIEDPIEYTLEGINQVQLRELIGLDFASAMRTFLRQDPDIIMVGEVRDVNTANMAIRASLTGHLVLSTIHTNSAWGIVARLIDMGVPGYLLADTLNTAVAQRLVRRLCPQCKVPVEPSQLAFPTQFKLPHPLEQAFEPGGCEHCYFTGYRGRQAVYEVIPMDDTLSTMIKEIKLDARQVLREKGIVSLPENAFSLLATGQTSLREVYPILMTQH